MHPPIKSGSDSSANSSTSAATYSTLVAGISCMLEQARRVTVRAVNSVLTITYWEIGRRIVEFEQGGKKEMETRRRDDGR